MASYTTSLVSGSPAITTSLEKGSRDITTSLVKGEPEQCYQARLIRSSHSLIVCFAMEVSRKPFIQFYRLVQQNRASISRINNLFVVENKAVIHFSIETEVEYISILLTVE